MKRKIVGSLLALGLAAGGVGATSAPAWADPFHWVTVKGGYFATKDLCTQMIPYVKREYPAGTNMRCIFDGKNYWRMQALVK